METQQERPLVAADSETSTSRPTVVRPTAAWYGSFSWRLFFERYLLVFGWLGLVVFLGFSRPDAFLQSATLYSIFGSSAIYVILGLAGLCTSVVNEIDLTVPSIMGLAATIVPLLVSEHGTPTIVAVFVALVVGALCGIINATIVVVFRVDALIATLGMGTALLGVAEGISHQVPVSGLSVGFSRVSLQNFLGLSALFWYGLVLALIMGYVLAFTPLGRHIAFVGSNREVSRLAGIRVNRLRFGAYTLGGILAALAGVLLAAQLGGFEAASSSAYLLPTFAVVFLSAAVVRPGQFSPIGVVIAAYFISTGTLAIQFYGANSWAQQVFYGTALVGAVTIVTLVRRKSVGR